MAISTTQALVLRTYSLAEADKICVFLTRDLGKLRGVAHGALKMRSRFGSALEPFTEVTLTYYSREGQDLVSVSNCEIVRSSFELASRDVKIAVAFAYMAELLTEFVPDNEPNERVYRLVVATIDAVDKGGSVQSAVVYFETWLLRLAGFLPDVFKCSGCGEGLAAECYRCFIDSPRSSALIQLSRIASPCFARVAKQELHSYIRLPATGIVPGPRRFCVRKSEG